MMTSEDTFLLVRNISFICPGSLADIGSGDGFNDPWTQLHDTSSQRKELIFKIPSREVVSIGRDPTVK